jgi:CDGSH-type Zn-finger protein
MGSSHRQATKKGRIKVTQNGPYFVTGSIPLMCMAIEVDDEEYPLRWNITKTYTNRENYSLCHCGKSKNKPYCDASHVKVGFKCVDTADRTPYLEKARVYEGPELKLTDKKELCIGAGFCTRAGNIWNLTMHSDTPERRDTAIQEAADCPSGRLVEWDKLGNAIEPHFEPGIAVTEDQNGVPSALWVRGGIEIESTDGHVYETRNRVTLCRCGRSEMHPLCDGSHLGEDSFEKKP